MTRIFTDLILKDDKKSVKTRVINIIRVPIIQKKSAKTRVISVIRVPIHCTMIFKKILFVCLFCPLFLQSQTTVNTAKPWAYWWWLGSAVDSNGISKNLQDFAAAGFGGMHIIPIYGVKGEEAKFIPHLSPKWIEMLDFTVSEANRLGLGIDMTLGTGWPFGGSFVTAEDAAKSFKIKTDESGKPSLIVEPTKQKVKRAAPGGEGLVLDHFSETAV